jgi:hypothetical protein
MKKVIEALIAQTENIIEITGYDGSLSGYTESYQFLFMPTFEPGR